MPEETLRTINEQIDFSFVSSSTDKIKKSVQTTGISDQILAFAVEPTLKLGTSLRKQSSTGVRAKELGIQDTLKNCYKEHLTVDPDVKRIVNLLLEMLGVSSIHFFDAH